MKADKIAEISPLKNRLSSEISKDVYSRRLHQNTLVMFMCLACFFYGFGRYLEHSETTKQKIDDMNEEIALLEVQIVSLRSKLK